ncbi:MAG: zinc metalloprotease [Calditrichaeota bacterium]|nr:MAG: zinc metalloprotease [Calditrichota bacterium]
MKYRISNIYVLLLLLFSNIAFAQFKCGTEKGDPANTRGKSEFSGISENSGSIPVIFHVIFNSSQEGNISNSTIEAQFNVLQNKFSGLGFSYFLAGISRTQNNNWFEITATGDDVDSMRENLHIDTRRVLNIYITKLSGDTQGVAKYPWFNDWKQHGVVIDYRTLPGGSHPTKNQGKTLVHEVGHFWGLIHPWENEEFKCNEIYVQMGVDEFVWGDGVSDTPIQKSPTYGCPSFHDSCQSEPGNDSVHNYMDYADDPCMYEFTDGQIDRMNLKRSEYRPSIGGSTIYITENLDIGSNQSYEFHEGTYKFASGKKINVDGELNVNGSSFNPVTFTSSGSSWNGIYFASGSNGLVEYTNIENLTGGYYSGAITISNATPEFQYCNIEVTTGSNVFAVYQSGNYVTPRFYKSKIKSNSQSAFKTSGSNGYLSIYDCEIVQNSGNPALVASTGIIEFWRAATHYQGKNKIKGGKLYATNAGLIRAGLSSGQRDINHFCDSNASTLYVSSGGVIYAKYNYWYNGAPPTQINMGGTIYYSNNLGSSSCSGIYKIKDNLTSNPPHFLVKLL